MKEKIFSLVSSAFISIGAVVITTTYILTVFYSIEKAGALLVGFRLIAGAAPCLRSLYWWP